MFQELRHICVNSGAGITVLDTVANEFTILKLLTVMSEVAFVENTSLNFFDPFFIESKKLRTLRQIRSDSSAFLRLVRRPVAASWIRKQVAAETGSPSAVSSSRVLTRLP